MTTYDYADRPATLLARRSGKPDQALVNAASYLPSGPLSSLTLGNGRTETRAFTQRYFPSSITLNGLLGWTYTTDGVGNILSIADTLNAANNRTYGYQDNHYFLTQGNGPWGPRSWTYDKIRNRLTETRGATTDSYSYVGNSAAGRTPILSQIQLGAGGTRAYQFGPAGHLERIATGADATVFRNDAASRLSAVEKTTPQAGVSFRYDGRDYLIRADAEALPFLDGFESGNLCGWTAALGVASPPVCTTPAPPTVQPTYSSAGLLHALTRNAAPQSSSIFYFAGRPVAQLDISSGTENWKLLTTDHLGTPIAATSSAGALLWQGGFEPFGADWNGAAGAGVFLRLPGQWEEGAWGNVGVGLYYNVHRWQESDAGRYTQPDPAGLQAGPNPYIYALANPIYWADPLGLISMGDFVFQLCCRPIGGFRVINHLIGNQANHCYVRMTANAQNPVNARTWSIIDDNGWARPSRNHPADQFYGGPQDCGPKTCFDKDTLRCLEETTASEPIRRYPTAGGIFHPSELPNSNTFARRLSRCGIAPSPTANELNAPGWNWPYRMGTN